MAASGGSSANRDEAIELFNEAQNAGRDDRLQCLAHVQELVLHKEPALLEEFVPAFLQLEQDRIAVVRKVLVGFLDDVIKQFPQYLPQVMPALIRLCEDTSPLVLKRLVNAATLSIFRQGLTLITSVHSPLTATEKSSLWDSLKHFRAALCLQLTQPTGHEAVRVPVAKLLETLCLAFLPADPSPPSGTPSPAGIFNASLADPGLQVELANEARACLAVLVAALQPGAAATATVVVVVGALANVVKGRQACREIGCQALIAFAQSVAAAPLSASQATSLQHTLKASFVSLLKSRVLEGTSYHSQVREVLATIGARDQFEQLRRHSESASKRAAAREEENEEAVSAASAAAAEELAAKRARREVNATAEYEGLAGIDEISLNPEDADQIPQQVAGMPTYSDVVVLGPELLAELVIQLLKGATLPITDVTFTSTSAFSSLLARLSILAVNSALPTPPPRAAPVAQAAYRDPRRDPRLRDAPATADSAAPPTAAAVDPAAFVAQQLAAALAAGQAVLQPVLPPPTPAPVRVPMTLLPATPLEMDERNALSQCVFERLLDGERAAKAAGKVHERAVLIARLATRRPLGDPLLSLLIDHIAADLEKRLALAHVWLTHEARADSERYASLCGSLVEKAASVLQPKDRLLVRLCADLPSVPSTVLTRLADLCNSPDRAAVVCGTLREVLLLHPLSRPSALTILLQAASHADESIRGVAIRVLSTQLYLVSTQPSKTAAKKEESEDVEREMELDRIALRLSPQNSARIEEYAVELLTEALTAPTTPDGGGADVTMTEKHVADARDSQLPADESNKGGPAPPTTGGSAAATPAVSEAEEAVRRRVSLFFALAPRRGELLAQLLPLYGASSAAAKQVLHRLIPAVVRALPTNSPAILSLFNDPLPSAHPLLLQVMHTATENSLPTPELRNAAQTLHKKTDDARFMIPVVAALTKEQCTALLAKLVPLPTATLRAAFTRILSPVGSHPPPLTPAELLIALHLLQQPSAPKENAQLSLRQIAEATSLCFDMKSHYKHEVLAMAIQQLVDVVPLPALLMRTVILTAQRFPTLVSSGFITSTLSHLVRNRVWQDDRLWEGVIKCCKMVAPRSFTVLLQLPEAQLADALNRAPELKEPLQKYAAANVKNVPKTILKLLGVDETRKKVVQEK